MTYLPQFSTDLIDHLIEAFPMENPDPDENEKLIWMRAGKQELIEHLKLMRQRTEEDYMKDEIL